MKKTKKQRVLEFLKANGSITPMDALKYCGTMRLSAIIFDLKEDGYRIIKNNVEVKDRFGSKCVVAEYKLVAKRRKAA